MDKLASVHLISHTRSLYEVDQSGCNIYTGVYLVSASMVSQITDKLF